jgi:HAD superfamily hydrolase (TIGR01509 family)
VTRDAQPVELVIFDCDGVLIDSEIVVCRLVGEELTQLGYTISTREVIDRFAGRPEREMVADIEADWGQTLPGSFFQRCRQRTHEAYGSELQPISGVADMLGRIKIPVCVASSAYPEKLKLGLQSAGLYDRLAPNLISASYVAKGKPAPDVFLYAAGWMRQPVPGCLVIEDSVPGVRAAKAAGMRVVGFTGGSHCQPGHSDRLKDAGADSILSDMRELSQLVPEALA